MGLIYSSADSSQLISALRSNIQSAKETTSQLTSGSQRIVSAVDGRTLAGAAYTAGKGLFSQLIIPTISRVSNAFSQLEQELQTFQSADGVIKGEGSYLDEDILKRQLEIKKAQRSSALTSVSTLTSQIKLATTPEMSSYIRSTQRELNGLADRLSEDIRKLEKKLQALHTFSSSTNGLFSESLNELKVAMQGVTVLSKTIVMNTGDYLLPQGTDLNIFSDKNAKDILMNQKTNAKELLKNYEIKKYVNADGSVTWALYKAGKWLPREGNENAYSALDSIQNELKSKDYNEYSVKKNQVLVLPGFGSIGTIGKIGKGIITITKGLNILDKLNGINIMNSDSTVSEHDEINELLDRTTETTSKKGKAKNYDVDGDHDLQDALDDFDALGLKNVKKTETSYGEGRVGYYDDGTKVSVRKDSGTGGPTIEITEKNKPTRKIRYKNNK